MFEHTGKPGDMVSFYGSPGASDWRQVLSGSVTSADELAGHLELDADPVRRTAEKYPMRINPYFLSVIKAEGAPLMRQAVPDPAELEEDPALAPDPLSEEPQSPVPNLIHRYPDRVVFMVSGDCAIYCRYCMRKRRLGAPAADMKKILGEGLEYIKKHEEIREVIISGGDPLLLSDERLREILFRLRQIPHVELLRIHSRAPGALPARITPELASMLSCFAPLYLNIQFNHPGELTSAACEACARLADAGIPLGSQTVLLKGVNDEPGVMMELMRRLLRNRVRPYYLHHADPVQGTSHFRTSIEKGLEIMRSLRGRISGMGVPFYMIDLPGGGGKVPLLPDYAAGEGENLLYVKNYSGEVYKYPVSLRKE